MKDPLCTCLTELEDDAYGPGGPMSGKARPGPCPLHPSKGAPHSSMKSELEAPFVFTPTEDELRVINQLADEKDLSPSKIITQALRLYQLYDSRLKDGETVTWSGDAARLQDFVGSVLTLNYPRDDTSPWVVVPREPSEEMYQAGDDARVHADDGYIKYVRRNTQSIWKAMLDQRPDAPSLSLLCGAEDDRRYNTLKALLIEGLQPMGTSERYMWGVKVTKHLTFQRGPTSQFVMGEIPLAMSNGLSEVAQQRLDRIQKMTLVELTDSCRFSTNTHFSYHDEKGEHDPAYVVLPGGSMIPINDYPDGELPVPTDAARAAFIVCACNFLLDAVKVESFNPPPEEELPE